jgi:hypothetical protein
MKIIWNSTTQYHRALGKLEKGKEYNVPKHIAETWVKQGVAKLPQKSKTEGKKWQKKEDF